MFKGHSRFCQQLFEIMSTMVCKWNFTKSALKVCETQKRVLQYECSSVWSETILYDDVFIQVKIQTQISSIRKFKIRYTRFFATSKNQTFLCVRLKQPHLFGFANHSFIRGHLSHHIRFAAKIKFLFDLQS